MEILTYAFAFAVILLGIWIAQKLIVWFIVYFVNRAFGIEIREIGE